MTSYPIMTSLFDDVTDDAPDEVLEAGLGDAVVEDAHALDHLALHLLCALDVVLRQEVISHSNQCILELSQNR